MLTYPLLLDLRSRLRFKYDESPKKTLSRSDQAAVQAMADYEETPNAVVAASNRSIVFINVGDLNGDSEHNYYIFYPNEDRQVFYIFPNR